MWRVAAFGFVLTMSSAFGQTHFVSLFNAQIRGDFGLSHSGISGLYSLATLLSAAFLPWLGRLIDQADLRVYTACVIGGLALASCALAFSAAWWQLCAAFFMLRLCGQGLSSHTGLATTTRLAHTRRGRALSLAGLGFSTGEALAAPTVALLLAWLTWREVWLAAAAAQIVVVMTAAQMILSKLPHHPPALANENAANSGDGDDISWTRGQVLRDIRFWRAAPALFSPPLVITALLFHQSSLAEFEGVDFRVWSSGFAAYALASVGASLTGGGLVDKFGATKLAKWCLLPLILASLIPLLMDGATLPFVYYALMGMTVGLGVPSVNALWAEVYGLAHLGAVRAMKQALGVLFSAVGPVVYGLLLDAGLGWDTILLLTFAWMSAAFLLFFLTPMHKRPPPVCA